MHCLGRYPLLAALCALTGGCGGSDPGPTPPPASSVPLAQPPAADGELVARGEASPQDHGPYALEGRYRVRFEQQAPEDPSLDFTAQTPFSAKLVPTRGGAEIPLFTAAARSGTTTVTAAGRYTLVVEFGDFPYAVRLTRR